MRMKINKPQFARLSPTLGGGRAMGNGVYILKVRSTGCGGSGGGCRCGCRCGGGGHCQVVDSSAQTTRSGPSAPPTKRKYWFVFTAWVHGEA